MAEKDEMRIAEAAQIAGVSKTTIRRWIHSGRLQARLSEGVYGEEYLISKDDLIQTMEQKSPTIVYRDSPEPELTIPQSMLSGLLKDVVARDREETRREVEQLKQELQAVKEILHREVAATQVMLREQEEKLKQRDDRLMETLRAIQEAKEQPVKKSIWPWRR